MANSLFPFILTPALSLQGQFMGAAKLAFYLTDTLTLATVYDADGDPISQAANGAGVVGVEADSYGRYPTIYLDNAVTYRVRQRTALGVQIGDDIDPLVPTGQGILDLTAALLAPSGAGKVGFSHDEDYSAGTVGFHIKKFRCVTDAPYGAKGNGTDDDTNAINAALAEGGDLHFDGSFLISDRLLVTSTATNIILHGDTSVHGSPWTYPGSQSPFGSLFLITADNCSIKGAGMGSSSIIVTGTSQANAVTFQNCKVGGLAFLSLIGNKATGTAISDDTFQTGFSILNSTAGNTNGTFSNALIESIESTDWLQYGGQTYGDLASTTMIDCWIHDNGKTGDALSVGSGLAITRGPRNVKVIACTIENNKLHGILGTSAGLNSYDIAWLQNTIRNNGARGVAWLEESDFASTAGTGLDGLDSLSNDIYGNGAGGEWYGTFDSVGFLKNVLMDNMTLNNTGPGVQINTNDDPDNRTSNVNVRSRISGNSGGGLVIGVKMDDTVTWDSQLVTGNTGGDVLNSGDSTLVSNSLGLGSSIASDSTITLPPEGDVFLLTGTTSVQNITLDPGRRVSFILGGAITFQTGGNLVMLSDFVGTGNSVITFVGNASSWFKQDSSVNA
jgi:hypothetical protein